MLRHGGDFRLRRQVALAFPPPSSYESLLQYFAGSICKSEGEARTTVVLPLAKVLTFFSSLASCFFILKIIFDFLAFWSALGTWWVTNMCTMEGWAMMTEVLNHMFSSTMEGWCHASAATVTDARRFAGLGLVAAWPWVGEDSKLRLNSVVSLFFYLASLWFIFLGSFKVEAWGGGQLEAQFFEVGCFYNFE